ncbi:MAG: M28 family peptidase, partial [Thermoleophilaceae bacterium]|nr:M28 family peptidase [Thermoleophilaceae bacterium]
MIEPRIYRAAFLPALLAVVLTAFSLQNRPSAAPQGLAADVLFDGRLAAATTRGIVRTSPDRAPGSAGNQTVAREVARRIARSGFEVTINTFEADGRTLRNVVARRSGASRKQLVVMADRDADSVPDATGSAADTAALIELARVFKGRASRRTIVLVSTDGGTLGDAGALRFARTAPDRDQIEAVVAISDLGARRAEGPLTVQWSNDSRRGSIGLGRTVNSSLRQELDDFAGDPGPLAQMARLAFPIGIGDQGVLLEDGLQAVRISGSGELPPPRGERRLEDLDVDRLGALGRGALRSVSALDGAPVPEPGPRSYLLTRKVLPGWTISLLAVTLIFPALVASIDAIARARRRRERVAPWWRWIALAVLPFLIGLGVAELIVAFGGAPDVSSGAAPP